VEEIHSDGRSILMVSEALPKIPSCPGVVAVTVISTEINDPITKTKVTTHNTFTLELSNPCSPTMCGFSLSEN
jgi:hypothetical protein